MRILVCGGRDYRDYERACAVLWGIHDKTPISMIIEGGARGADYHAFMWAIEAGVPYEEYKADWNVWGKKAGHLRNQRMIDEGRPDLVIAFPGGSGTADMVKRAKNAMIEVIEYE